ncbi:MAG: stage II sporulation protein D [Firmicutes bacterium]|nr:stage II sporulation protein D [Bacillota bacterium]
MAAIFFMCALLILVHPAYHVVKGGEKLRALKIAGVMLATMFVLILLVPALIVRGCGGYRDVPRVPVDPEMVQVWNHQTGELMPMPLGEYLLGVVAAEMPVSFHIEALKAQAVVARTYAINKLRSRGGAGCDQHPEADICTDHTHCQAWLSREDAMQRWPLFRQGTYWDKITLAVSETRGSIITHQGAPIDAVFHSTCGGSTENSEDVWTNTIPYLRAVECGYCNHSPRLTETVSMTVSEAAEKLGVGGSSLEINVERRTESGRIISVSVNGQAMRGLDFRTALGLRSSLVTWLRDQNRIVFTTTGYGHAVGLCQYGADGMADLGFEFTDILQHYYTDIQVQRLSSEE